jgi:hypothetical protein
MRRMGTSHARMRSGGRRQVERARELLPTVTDPQVAAILRARVENPDALMQDIAATLGMTRDAYWSRLRRALRGPREHRAREDLPAGLRPQPHLRLAPRGRLEGALHRHLRAQGVRCPAMAGRHLAATVLRRPAALRARGVRARRGLPGARRPGSLRVRRNDRQSRRRDGQGRRGEQGRWPRPRKPLHAGTLTTLPCHGATDESVASMGDIGMADKQRGGAAKAGAEARVRAGCRGPSAGPGRPGRSGGQQAQRPRPAGTRTPDRARSARRRRTRSRAASSACTSAPGTSPRRSRRRTARTRPTRRGALPVVHEPDQALTGVQTYTGENHVRFVGDDGEELAADDVFEPHEENQTYRVVKQAVYEVFNYAGSQQPMSRRLFYKGQRVDLDTAARLADAQRPRPGPAGAGGRADCGREQGLPRPVLTPGPLGLRRLRAALARPLARPTPAATTLFASKRRPRLIR